MDRQIDRWRDKPKTIELHPTFVGGAITTIRIHKRSTGANKKISLDKVNENIMTNVSLYRNVCVGANNTRKTAPVSLQYFLLLKAIKSRQSQ